MRGLGGIAQSVSRLLEAFGITLQPWMAPAVVLVLMVALLPLILRNMRTGRARKLLKEAAMVPGEQGRLLEQRALDLVGRQPLGLVAVAEEALRRGRTDLARQAIVHLGATGKARPLYRRLRAEIEGPLPASLAEMVIVVERLVDAGMLDEAARRLERARKRWPAAAELDTLDASIAEARQPSPGTLAAPDDAGG